MPITQGVRALLRTAHLSLFLLTAVSAEAQTVYCAFDYITSGISYVNRFQIKIDDGLWQDVTVSQVTLADTLQGYTTFLTPLPALGMGPHQFSARACTMTACGPEAPAFAFYSGLPNAPVNLRLVDAVEEVPMPIGSPVISHFARTTVSGTTQAVTITSTTAGRMLVLSAAWFQGSGATISGITGAGTWESTAAVNGDANSHIQIWYCRNISAAVTSVTVTFTGTGAVFEADVSELPNAEISSSALDVNTSNTGTGTAVSVTVPTLAIPDEIIIGMASHTGTNATWTHDTGDAFTQISENENNSAGQTYNTQYKIVASVSAPVVNWTIGSSQTWFAKVVSFRASTGSPWAAYAQQ